MWGDINPEAALLSGGPSGHASAGAQIPPDSPLAFANEPPYMPRRGGAMSQLPPMPAQAPVGGAAAQRPHDVVMALLCDRHAFRSSALAQAQRMLPPAALGQFLLSGGMFDEPVKALAMALDTSMDPAEPRAATAAAAVSALRNAELLL